jgi:dihydrofolate synthase/folylpolyglutamate synthase
MPHDDGLEYRHADDVPRRFPRPGFGGRIQLGNAAAVIAAVDALQAELPVAETALAAGLATARVRGRCERVGVNGSEWIFDVAHNPASAALLFASLAELAPVEQTIAVFGAMRDKDLTSVIRPFVPLVDGWFVGGIDSDRGAAPAEIAAVLDALGARGVRCHADVPAAARAALDTGAGRVLAFGSFYTVGPAMQTVGLY